MPVEIIVSSGVTSSSLTISSGFDLDVQSGGQAVATTVLQGGTVTVETGGAVSNTHISSGGSMLVDVGADATQGTQVLPGGTESLFGIDQGFTISGTSIAPATVTEYAGASALSPQILMFGQLIDSGGLVRNANVHGLGSIEILSGGVASSTKVGGTLDVSSGGTAVSGSVLPAGVVIVKRRQDQPLLSQRWSYLRALGRPGKRHRDLRRFGCTLRWHGDRHHRFQWRHARGRQRRCGERHSDLERRRR